MSMAAFPVPGTGLSSGFGFNSPPISVPLMENMQSSMESREPIDRETQIQSYLAIILSFSLIKLESAQRIILKKTLKDIQTEKGVSLPNKIANSLLVTTPLIVYFTSVTSANAQEKRTRKCNLPLDTGEGDMLKEKFYYDVDTDMCRKFLYKGSAGNENRFKQKEECELTCRPFSAEGKEVLRQEIIASQTTDILIYLSEFIFDSLGTALYSIWLASVPQQTM